MARTKGLSRSLRKVAGDSLGGLDEPIRFGAVGDFGHSLCSVLSTRLERVAKDLLPAVATADLAVRKGLNSLHILVADDVADSADALACLLRLYGHSVSVALGGAQAIVLAAAVHPQVAVLDIGMPDIDGYSVATSIRQSEWGQAVHLIAFSGWNDRQSRQRAAAAGFDLYVVKPIDPPQFLQQINELERQLCQLPG